MVFSFVTFFKTIRCYHGCIRGRTPPGRSVSVDGVTSLSAVTVTGRILLIWTSLSLLPHSSLQSSSSLLKSSLMGVVTILGMGDTAAMLRSMLASSSSSPTGTERTQQRQKRYRAKVLAQILLEQLQSYTRSVELTRNTDASNYNNLFLQSLNQVIYRKLQDCGVIFFYLHSQILCYFNTTTHPDESDHIISKQKQSLSPFQTSEPPLTSQILEVPKVDDVTKQVRRAP